MSGMTLWRTSGCQGIWSFGRKGQLALSLPNTSDLILVQLKV